MKLGSTEARHVNTARYPLRSSCQALSHLPTSSSLSMSTPVLMPIPCNMYTTSSVGTLPDAPFAYGQPPNPATELSTIATPSCSVGHTRHQDGVTLRTSPHEWSSKRQCSVHTCSAANMLGSAMAYVLWKWTAMLSNGM